MVMVMVGNGDGNDNGKGNRDGNRDGNVLHYVMLLVIVMKGQYCNSSPRSGPPSCLCSKTEECQTTGDNELAVVPNITQVRQGRRKGSFYSPQVIYRAKTHPK